MTADGSANGDTPLLERERELAALVEALIYSCLGGAKFTTKARS